MAPVPNELALWVEKQRLAQKRDYRSGCECRPVVSNQGHNAIFPLTLRSTYIYNKVLCQLFEKVLG